VSLEETERSLRFLEGLAVYKLCPVDCNNQKSQMLFSHSVKIVFLARAKSEFVSVLILNLYLLKL
jgi:hypothetical protein